ncbi:uncharacterized protein F21D5.5 [Neocloeon triangulifer]|uniref:uncharacterized protein F21D5.5 n=1 Tax=Neocloeon triangulifer TaxID=2078957 RepID=UPI00286F7BFA|nr:uncharacterized protein F21D5.5 [Neocloeon triangulifer]
MIRRKCFIQCVEDSHDPILLPNCKELTIGRSVETKIKNTRCSRNQVSLLANYAQATVLVKQLGENPCGLESGVCLFKGDSQTLGHGDTLELLEGLHKHRIVFDPPPEKCTSTDKRKVNEELATEEIVSPSKTKKAKLEAFMDGGLRGDWESVDHGKMLVFTPHNSSHGDKVAGYDLDWTIVGTKSGRVYPKDRDDWQILLPEIPGKLKKMHAEGYKLVLFSNQAGIGSRKIIISEFQHKIESVIRKLGVPMQAFISTGTSVYRKPLTGMWDYLAEKKNHSKTISLLESLYCGDAAGRPEGWATKKKKDFSCSDRLFAMNIGIKFYTPEEHFQGKSAAPFKLPDFQPLRLKSDVPLCEPASAQVTSSEQELVILVGGPGSGKSSFARRHLTRYTYVNMDQLKSAQRCVQEVRKALEQKSSVVVDNTNPDKKSRARFMAIAKQVGVKCRCFKMLTSKEHSRHNNRFRELIDSSHATISEMIIRQFEKNYQEPEIQEGFHEIVGINFVPYFEKEEHEKLYQKFLVA